MDENLLVIFYFHGLSFIILINTHYILLAEGAADFLINNVWQPGFPFLKPLINDLVSTAFTDIFNESFRYFPIDNFIKS